jgi:hypothetical protein
MEHGVRGEGGFSLRFFRVPLLHPRPSVFQNRIAEIDGIQEPGDIQFHCIDSGPVILWSGGPATRGLTLLQMALCRIILHMFLS